MQWHSDDRYRDGDGHELGLRVSAHSVLRLRELTFSNVSPRFTLHLWTSGLLTAEN